MAIYAVDRASICFRCLKYLVVSIAPSSYLYNYPKNLWGSHQRCTVYHSFELSSMINWGTTTNWITT